MTIVSWSWFLVERATQWDNIDEQGGDDHNKKKKKKKKKKEILGADGSWKGDGGWGTEHGEG